MNRKKFAYLDYLRVFSMICVIIMHVSASALSKEINTTWQILNIFTSFSFIAVPLFFMISGAVILSSPNTENPWYTLRKRIPKLLIPLIVWSMIALLPAFLVPENTQNGFQFINYLGFQNNLG